MNLRSATPADLDLLRHWDEQPHVTASDPNDDWGWEVELERNPDWREQLIAEIDGRPIGFIQIIDRHERIATIGVMSLRIFGPLTSGLGKGPI
jgi:Acetyltransferase (GNAT) domain